MMSDWILLWFAAAAWFVLIVDKLLIHEFVGMYDTMTVIAVGFTIGGIAIFLTFHYTDPYKGD